MKDEKQKDHPDHPEHPSTDKDKPGKPDVQPLDGDPGPGVPEDPGKKPEDPPPGNG